ncbi:MAG: excinuclease ABC subunit UvrA [Spirochaetales bacterium]|jgi:excinuclease ABC subunit A|nr:excinuclease ABC subunit UvrA [Spirochaetales bacterium]
MDKIIIRGAREHNLKNIDLELPRERLIVISGLSGSGKSSLAFDTIFAEGQRRYVESLSSYARQFLDRLEKPDVDYIGGLSPAISIEQKTTHRNPRSTVGTVTEIYDYLRLLFARLGMAHCPLCGKPVREQSVDQIIDAVLSYPPDSRIMILAPVVQGKKGEHAKILADAAKAGFVRARVDGEIVSLGAGSQDPRLDRNKKHRIEIIVDRLRVGEESRGRIAESVETALDTSGGTVVVVRVGDSGGGHSGSGHSGSGEEFFSSKNACPDCGISLPELQPRLFSFNNPYGACPACCGLGITLEFDPDLLIPNKDLSFNEGGIAAYNPDAQWYRSRFRSLAKHLNFSLDTPLGKLPTKVYNAILYGTKEKLPVSYTNKEGTGRFEYNAVFPGILEELRRRYLETASEGVKEWLERFMSQRPCGECGGKRLKKESLAVTVGGKNIFEVSCLSVGEALDFFGGLKFSQTQRLIARQILKEIQGRLSFLKDVGLEYLTLERKASTLSGGEAQRIRLATQIGSALVGVLYILDEPTIGLHQRDNQRLIETLKHLRDTGNTLIVVEHDEQTLRSADYIVDLGPGAGVHGGHVVAEGTLREILANKKSLTGQFLNRAITIDSRPEKREGNGLFLKVRGASENNLKNLDVSFPLGKFIVITGVSGSGKSSLLTDILYPALSNRLNGAAMREGNFAGIDGCENLDKVINIDQDPIGRTPRSNPATYVGFFTFIRDLFAALPESKARGYRSGRFSFNVPGGRCENCRGDGTIRIEMHFLPDVYVTCEVCKGKRFNHETLDIRYKGKNIHDILEMTIEEGLDFFSAVPRIATKLQTLNSVGLGYIRLGQSALTLSGGEAQRIKLAFELSKKSTGRTFYILDEPTTGLHFADVKVLLDVLQKLVDRGNTMVLIEHNFDVIKQADWIIDLGPEGGSGGGEIIAQGLPRDIAKNPRSYTGKFLREVI